MIINKKIVFALLIVLLFLITAHYNQNIHENYALDAENDLSLLETEKEAESDFDEQELQIIVHLAGAVKNAGVYKLNKSDRLVDLIKAAGGLKENADLERTNLAEKLYDGQKLIIPEIRKSNIKNKVKELSNSQSEQQKIFNNYSVSNESTLININQAGQNELEKLSGIGPSKAAAIIKYREQNDYFTQKDDLLKVSGIGEKTLENIKDEIVLH